MWTREGIAAIDYPHAFHPELAPAHIAYALVLAGIRPPVAGGRPFRYAELGCGQGLTSNLLAALHPEGRFEAIDALSSHVENARRLARAADLDNVRFAALSFADFAARPKGQDLDIIAVHGVWSWVAPEHRAQLVEIARRRLKPGGVFFVSYNALPGWAEDLPFRRLLLEAVERAQGSLPERIAAALDHLGQRARAGAFAATPSMLDLLRRLDGKSDGYIAHEFLNRHWQPFHPSEVAAQLAPAGLTLAASATLADHLIAPGPECRFRRDLFVKAPEPLSAAERARHLRAQRFGLVVPRPRVPDHIMGRDGATPIDATVADALAAGPRAGLDALALCAIAAAAPLPPEHPAWPERCARFNAAVLDTLGTASAIRQLASPTLGTGIVADLMERLFLLAERQGADPADFAWAWLGARGKRLRRDGNGEWLEGKDNLAEARRLHRTFRAHRRSLFIPP